MVSQLIEFSGLSKLSKSIGNDNSDDDDGECTWMSATPFMKCQPMYDLSLSLFLCVYYRQLCVFFFLLLNFCMHRK